MDINSIIKKVSMTIVTGLTLASLSAPIQAVCRFYQPNKEICVNETGTRRISRTYQKGKLKKEIRDYGTRPLSSTTYHYDKKGNLESTVLDEKMDGKPDQIKFFRRIGNKIFVYVDRNGDYKYDETFTYTYDQKGEIVGITADYNNDGKIDEIIYPFKKKK